MDYTKFSEQVLMLIHEYGLWQVLIAISLSSVPTLLAWHCADIVRAFKGRAKD